jgi:hypothetical protein
MRLLTEAHANAKTAKNASKGDFLSYILHFAPYKLSGVNVCPMASRGCAAACLNTAGRGRFDSIQQARIKKTQRFFKDRQGFLADLVKDLQAVERKAKKHGLQAVVRLNGTSDIDWTAVKTDDGQNVFERFKTIQFYDYTKVIRRLEKMRLNPIPNYHLTFSRSESNHADCLKAIQLGFNVAAVFQTEAFPETFESRPVIDGDSHDLRFLDLKPLDGQGAFVALKAKGQAKKDLSGFVIQLETAIGKVA